jgi:predicted phage terminase large subunit-like protein
MFLEQLVELPVTEVREALLELDERELLIMRWELAWRAQTYAHDRGGKQLPPAEDWYIWLIQSGRGFGKTLAAAHWLGLEAARHAGSINFVIAPTVGDLIGTCFEGETGLLSVIPSELVVEYITSSPIAPYILLDNRSLIRGFSAEKPERLRGPQCHRAWCDEVAVWQYDLKTWDNLIFGMRLGARNQVVATSTPKPRPLIKKLATHPRAIVTRGTTYENRANLSDSFLQEILAYEGTRVGRQEIHGELIDPEEAGIVKRSQIRLWPADKPLPEFSCVIMSLDTAFTEQTFEKKTFDPDFTACTTWGVFREKTLTSRRGHVELVRWLNSIMLLDAWQDRLGMPELIERVKQELKNRWGAPTPPLVAPAFGPARLQTDGRKVDVVLIEEKGSGITLRQMLELDGIVTHKFNPGKADKLARLHAVSPLFTRGRVWTVESGRQPGQPRPWAESVIAQLCSFVGPGSIAHDDMVDSTTQALLLAIYQRRLVTIPEEYLVKELEKEVESKLTGLPYPNGQDPDVPPPRRERNPYAA